MSTSNKGIDWGNGKTNIDKEICIRYGVINQNEVLQMWADSSEAYYGEPHCPECGNDAKENPYTEETEEYEPVSKYSDDFYVCDNCKNSFGSEEAFGEEPIAFFIDSSEYKAEQSHDDTDIFILKSLYFTYAQFCSPCAPGAGYIMNEIEDKDPNNKTYCFGHNFFESGKAPYKVYSVETGKQIIIEEKHIECPNCHGSGWDTVARIALVRETNTTATREDLIKHGYSIDELDRFKCFRCYGVGKIKELEEIEVE